MQILHTSRIARSGINFMFITYDIYDHGWDWIAPWFFSVTVLVCISFDVFLISTKIFLKQSKFRCKKARRMSIQFVFNIFRGKVRPPDFIFISPVPTLVLLLFYHRDFILLLQPENNSSPSFHEAEKILEDSLRIQFVFLAKTPSSRSRKNIIWFFSFSNHVKNYSLHHFVLLPVPFNSFLQENCPLFFIISFLAPLLKSVKSNKIIPRWQWTSGERHQIRWLRHTSAITTSPVMHIL